MASVPLVDTKRMPRLRWFAVGASALLAATCIAVAAIAWNSRQQEQETSDELLLKIHLAAHEPYSAPSNLYLWWGPETNHRFVGSGERIRQLLHMGNIEGGEWRDPMFLGNNGVETFTSSRFRRISEACCSTILIPPMEWEYPVFNTHKIIGQRIRNFVANGNMLVLTGGIPAIEFINSYFFYTMELADGNYSPGPFRRLPGAPKQLLDTPTVLPQKGISVTAVKKESLPSGTQVLWGTPRSSPVFLIKFCETESPDEGMPPVKVLPRDCPLSEKAGRPCSCGHIMYIGYNYNEQYPSRWDKVLLGSVEILNPSWEGGSKASSPPSALSAAQPAAAPAAPAAAAAAAPAPAQPAQAPAAAAAPSKAADSAGKEVLGAVAKESAVIAKLESALQTLSLNAQRSHAAADHSTVDTLGEEPLSVLESRAKDLVRELDAAQGRRRRAGGRGRGSSHGEDRLLQDSLITLSKDVAKINGKVDKLADVVARTATAPHPSAASAPAASAATPPAAAAPAAPAAAAATGGGASAAALRARLAKAEADKARLAKQAAAYKRELTYEQSMPTPQYSYAQPDHTTPMFGPGGVRIRAAAAASACGTMCRLKRLVQKTRARIDRELQAAMH